MYLTILSWIQSYKEANNFRMSVNINYTRFRSLTLINLLGPFPPQGD